MVTKSSSGIARRVLDEGKELTGVAVYFWVLIGLFTVFKSLVLNDENLIYHQGFAIINAWILAKVVIAAEYFRIAENFKDRPLIYPIVFKSTVFCVLLMSFYVAEETVDGLWHGKTFADSIPEIGGGTWKGMIVVATIMFICLIPFFSYRELARVLGKDRLHSLIFKRGTFTGPA